MKRTDQYITQTESQTYQPWNVLIYLASDNNLKEESVFILTEILRAGTTQDVNVIAQLDSGRSITRYDFNKLAEREAETVSDNRALEQLDKVILNDSDELQNTPDVTLLKEFLIRNVKPESRNLIVLSGHGSGAVGDFLSSEDPPRALSIPTLREALSAVLKSVSGESEIKIDILGMDSCLMSMAEVCYEVKDSVNFILGAEGFARNTGWPYREILKIMQGNSNISARSLACNIVKEYIHYYSPYTISGVSVDQAACDLNYIDNLATAVKELSGRLKTRLEGKNDKYDKKLEDALILAHWRAQSYKFEQYVDLWDFCDLLQKGCEDEKIREACEEVKRVIKEEVVISSCYSGAAFQHSHGISIYFPWAKSDLERDLPHYRKLLFHEATYWGDFLQVYGEKTQREPRKADPNKVGEGVLKPMPLDFDVGVNITMNTRIVIVAGTDAATSGGQFRLPKVKNPADSFYKFDDECAGGCSE